MGRGTGHWGGGRPLLTALLVLVLLATFPGSAGGDETGGVRNVRSAATPSAVFTIGVDIGGIGRTAQVVTPPARTPRTRRPPPMLIVLHGVGMRGTEMRGLGFDELAAGRGVVVVYPDAWRGSWNDGRPGLESASPSDLVDDIAFLRALIAEVGVQAGADTSRVAVVGFSNGALMTGRLACDPPPGVVAVGLVAGTVGQGFADSCRSARRLPVVQVAGTADAIVPYNGGQIADYGGRRRGRVAAVGEFLTFWAAVGGCGPTALTPLADTAIPVSRLEAQGCARGARVVHYRVRDGGHEWYRVDGFDTTAVLWSFVTPWLGVGASPLRPWRPAA